MQFTQNFIFRSPLNSFEGNIDHEVFSEALYIATPALYETYSKNYIAPLTEKKELKKLNISLYKYQTRASNRCTPFGLFASVGIGEWGDSNTVLCDSELRNSLYRKTRLDMNVLYSLAQQITRQKYIAPHLKFYPNTSIYTIGDSFRYVEYYYVKSRRYHRLNKVDNSEYLQKILHACIHGLNKMQICTLLKCDEITEQEAFEFVEDIIDAQLLINELEPTLSGVDYFDRLINKLNEIYRLHPTQELNSLISVFIEIDHSIKDIDKSIFNPISEYKKIHLKLKSILPELSDSNLFQTDLYRKPKTGHLTTTIQNQILSALKFLNKINAPFNNSSLEDFKKRFSERFEEAEIPLLLALDTESGIGYPKKDNNGVNELIDDIPSSLTNPTYEIKWDILQSRLHNILIKANNENKKIVEIAESDFEGINYSSESLPHSFAIMFKVLGSESEKIQFKSAGGSSAINLLGRFAGGDNHLEELILQIADFEQQQMPDKILAEIIHLPESRTGNILARPAFRRHEIPYLAKSSVDEAFQIRMEDLVIKIRNNRIILFDNRLHQEIIPRLGNAHNYSFNALPVYHFLCDLQNQDYSKPSLGFNFGVLSKQFDFLPRVEYQNIILSAAKWQLKRKQFEHLVDKNTTGEKNIVDFFEFKTKWNLPDKFVIADGDNELLIDCKLTIAIETFRDVIKNKNEVILEEYLFDSKDVLVKDSSGMGYTNECIAILLNENTKRNASIPIKNEKSLTKQTFCIGSEWLFYKIYCGVKTMDLILIEKIKHLSEKFLQEGIIDKWFFIRYADPETHLRYRIHVKDPNRYGEIIQTIKSELDSFIDEKIISKIQADCYNRELVRYGNNTIELVEELFYYDSTFVVDVLNELDLAAAGEIRWQIAIKSVDEFLNDFNLNGTEKMTIIDNLQRSFFEEHGGKKELKLLLDSKYRTLRSKVDTALDMDEDIENEYYPIVKCLKKRTEHNKAIIKEILALKDEGNLQLSIFNLIGSLLHMNLDRIFMGRNRTNELVIYDLLLRYYKSKIARMKKVELIS